MKNSEQTESPALSYARNATGDIRDFDHALEKDVAGRMAAEIRAHQTASGKRPTATRELVLRTGAFREVYEAARLFHGKAFRDNVNCVKGRGNLYDAILRDMKSR